MPSNRQPDDFNARFSAVRNAIIFTASSTAARGWRLRQTALWHALSNHLDADAMQAGHGATYTSSAIMISPEGFRDTQWPG